MFVKRTLSYLAVVLAASAAALSAAPTASFADTNAAGSKVFAPNAASARAAALAAPVPGWFVLLNYKTANVLAIKSGTDEPAGTPVIQWSPPSGSTVPMDQQWQPAPRPDRSSLAWRNAGTRNQFALSVEGNSLNDGARIVQWWYEQGNDFEHWVGERVGTVEGFPLVRYINVKTGKCLAVAGAGGSTLPGPGAQIVQWTCGNGLDQFWVVVG